MKYLTSLIIEALQIREDEVESIEKIGGMTNLNYLVKINGEDYVVRVSGNGTEDFINRKEEKKNLEYASLLGLNPELIYFNTDTGFKITRKIPNAITLTRDLAKKEDTMKKVVEVFRTLHHSKIMMTNRFELFKLMERYEKLALAENVAFFDGFEEVKNDVIALKERYGILKVGESSCHIDPACGNFIQDEAGKVYLIDWEYSGVFDPLWDIASYTMETGLSALDEEVFLTAYIQRNITESDVERMLMLKVFQDYLWSLWTLFKEAKGDNFGEYGKKRFDRIKKHISLYKKEFNSN